ncbi:hypothetical protein CRUP_006817, partial [Coryphaenoides rupestris]
MALTALRSEPEQKVPEAPRTMRPLPCVHKAFMRAGLLTVSTARPDSSRCSRSTEPPGNAPSFSFTSSGWKPWLAEYTAFCLGRSAQRNIGGLLCGLD